MQEWLNSLYERFKLTVPFFSIVALIIYLTNMDETFIEMFLFIALGGGACMLFFHLHVTWQRVISLLLAFIFFFAAAIWFKMANSSITSVAFPKLRDQLLWSKRVTTEEKLDYLYTENWDHDRAVSVFTKMSRKDAMTELRAKMRYGLNRIVPFFNKSVPDPDEYLQFGRLIVALKEIDFLTLENVTELADLYFAEYPFSALEEGSEAWSVALAMLDFCSNDCLQHTLLQDREADLPTDIANYIRQLLQK